MSNKELVDRNQILGNSKVEFDKALRGYDVNQVDEYIANIIKAQRNASENFDSQIKDLRNDNSMLKAAGLGIGMCNGLSSNPEMRDAADVITETDNNHDGLAPILEKV